MWYENKNCYTSTTVPTADITGDIVYIKTPSLPSGSGSGGFDNVEDASYVNGDDKCLELTAER
jgi:hypothetical protein